jgi:hypothetical protein
MSKARKCISPCLTLVDVYGCRCERVLYIFYEHGAGIKALLFSSTAFLYLLWLFLIERFYYNHMCVVVIVSVKDKNENCVFSGSNMPAFVKRKKQAGTTRMEFGNKKLIACN